MNKPLNKLMINLPAEPPLSSVGVVDSIDILGCTAPLGPFHIDGPYEATLLARNLDPRTSPVAALRESNAEALRATPRACIMDSLINHVPLQGTATIPSGCRDENGVVMHYEESTDMMHEDRTDGGPLRRWNHTVRLSIHSLPYFACITYMSGRLFDRRTMPTTSTEKAIRLIPSKRLKMPGRKQ
jgi:hypothetical protein